jgi:hypothetical protein
MKFAIKLLNFADKYIGHSKIWVFEKPSQFIEFSKHPNNETAVSHQAIDIPK